MRSFFKGGTFFGKTFWDKKASFVWQTFWAAKSQVSHHSRGRLSANKTSHKRRWSKESEYTALQLGWIECCADFIKGTRAFTVELTTNSNHMGSYNSESASLAVSSYITSKALFNCCCLLTIWDFDTLANFWFSHWPVLNLEKQGRSWIHAMIASIQFMPRRP